MGETTTNTVLLPIVGLPTGVRAFILHGDVQVKNFVLVDADLAGRLSRYNWLLDKRGTVFTAATLYTATSLGEWKQTTVRLSALILQLAGVPVPKHVLTGYKNGNKLDCRRENLFIRKPVPRDRSKR